MKQIAHCKPLLYLKIAETTINQQISVQKAHNAPLSLATAIIQILINALCRVGQCCVKSQAPKAGVFQTLQVLHSQPRYFRRFDSRRGRLDQGPAKENEYWLMSWCRFECTLLTNPRCVSQSCWLRLEWIRKAVGLQWAGDRSAVQRNRCLLLALIISWQHCITEVFYFHSNAVYETKHRAQKCCKLCSQTRFH